MAGAARRTEQSFKRAAKRIEKLRGKLEKRAISGLRVIGEEIMLDVKSARPGLGVPVDTGVLRGSGRVIGPIADAVTLSFGSAAAWYALRQHEDESLTHRIGEARYLVRGLDRWRANGVSVRRAQKQLLFAVEQLKAVRRAA